VRFEELKKHWQILVVCPDLVASLMLMATSSSELAVSQWANRDSGCPVLVNYLATAETSALDDTCYGCSAGVELVQH
jgi:hypothetical protein